MSLFSKSESMERGLLPGAFPAVAGAVPDDGLWAARSFEMNVSLGAAPEVLVPYGEEGGLIELAEAFDDPTVA